MKRKLSRRSRRKNPSSDLVLREAVDLADWRKPFYRLPIVFRGSLTECIAYARSRGCQWRRHADLLYGGYWEGAQTGLSLIPDTPGNVVTPPLGSRRGPPVRRNPRRRRCRRNSSRGSMPSKAFLKMTDLAAEWAADPDSAQKEQLLTRHQDQYDWPWSATGQQLGTWSELMRTWDMHAAHSRKRAKNSRHRRKNPCLPCLLLNPRGRKRSRRRSRNSGGYFSMTGIRVLPDRYSDDDPPKREIYTAHVPDKAPRQMRTQLQAAKREARRRGMTLVEYLSIPRDQRPV